jgi:hypothetical protein
LGKVVPYDVFLRARAQQCSGDGGAIPSRQYGVEPEASGSRDGRRRDARLTRALKEIREEYRLLPDVRPAKVREARRRIRLGFYERPEVLDEIVRRILADERDPEDESDRGGE